MILLGRVLDLFGVHPPLDEHLALHRPPVLQGVDGPARGCQNGADGLPFGLSLSGVDVNPIPQAAFAVFVQYGPNSSVVVPRHADHFVKRRARQMVALDPVPVVDTRAVRGRIPHERRDATPRRLNLLRYLGLELAVGTQRPLQSRQVLHDRAGNNRRRERHQIVDKAHKGFLEPTLDHLVFHLEFHALGLALGLFAGFGQQSVPDATGDFEHRVLVHCHPSAVHHHGLLSGLSNGFLLHVFRKVRNRRRVDGPRFFVAGTKQRVFQPGSSGRALAAGNHHVDGRAVGLLNLGQNIGVVFTPALAQIAQQALLDGLHFGHASHIPHLTHMGRKVLHHRGVVANLRLSLFFREHGG